MVIKLSKNQLFDGYGVKLAFIILGILYWVYGFTPYIDVVLSALVWLALLPTVITLFKTNIRDYHFYITIATLFLGLGTVIVTPNKRSTITMLVYALIKMVVLCNNSSKKSQAKIFKEFKNTANTISIIGTIIIVISLVTYFLNISIPYVYSASENATTLYVGINPGRGSLCGVFANENMLSNLCVITLGCSLIMLENTSKKALYVLSVFIITFTQVLTASRGGFLGLLIILGFYFWYKFKGITKNNAQNNRLRYASIAILFIVFFVFCIIDGDFNLFGLLNRTQDNFNKNTEIRLYLWDAAIRALIYSPQNFIFGIGHNISDIMEKFCQVSFASRLYTNVHNAYIQKALEFGVLSSLLMIVFFLKTILPGLLSLRRHGVSNMSLHLLEAIVIVLLLTNLVETDMLGRGFEGTVVWIFAGYYYSLSKSIILNKIDNL